MKNLKLPEHFDVGDLVQPCNDLLNKYEFPAGKWLPEVLKDIHLVTAVDWSKERITISVISSEVFDFRFEYHYSFKEYKLLKKSSPLTTKYLRLIV